MKVLRRISRKPLTFVTDVRCDNCFDLVGTDVGDSKYVQERYLVPGNFNTHECSLCKSKRTSASEAALNKLDTVGLFT